MLPVSVEALKFPDVIAPPAPSPPNDETPEPGSCAAKIAVAVLPRRGHGGPVGRGRLRDGFIRRTHTGALLIQVRIGAIGPRQRIGHRLRMDIGESEGRGDERGDIESNARRRRRASVRGQAAAPGADCTDRFETSSRSNLETPHSTDTARRTTPPSIADLWRIRKVRRLRVIKPSPRQRQACGARNWPGGAKMRHIYKAVRIACLIALVDKSPQPLKRCADLENKGRFRTKRVEQRSCGIEQAAPRNLAGIFFKRTARLACWFAGLPTARS